MKSWLATLWSLIVARSRTTLGLLVAFLATVMPLVEAAIPFIGEQLPALPLTPGQRAAIQTGLQVAGVTVALWSKVRDAVLNRTAGWRIDDKTVRL